MRALLITLFSLAAACAVAAEVEPDTKVPPSLLKPGVEIDYGPISFEPKAWERLKIPSQMILWEGKEVVFLTSPGDFDAALMTAWVNALDGGWRTYAELTGRRPELFKQVRGKPVIAAVPDGRLTCGAGCGYIGVTGVELAMFYDQNYPALLKDPKAIPHYVFYEMGRNFYTFGERHSCFITGYAVFMRYVCMDALRCKDVDLPTRKVIEQAEQLIAKGDMDFVKTFTNLGGLGEKAPRVKTADGKWLHPSDQPVTYASAMLRLRRECGGDAWLKRFFAELARCPEVKAKTKEDALKQCWHWFLCASVAAGRDLSAVFCDQWRMPLGPETRKALAAAAWDAKGLAVSQLIAEIAPVWTK